MVNIVDGTDILWIVLTAVLWVVMAVVHIAVVIGVCFILEWVFSVMGICINPELFWTEAGLLAVASVFLTGSHGSCKKQED